jgi:hypothetical protein
MHRFKSLWPIFFILTCFFAVNLANAHDDINQAIGAAHLNETQDNDCREVYKKKLAKHIKQHETIGRSFYLSASGALVMAFFNPLISAVIMGGHFGAIMLSSKHGSQKGNIFNLQYLDTYEGQRLFKDMVEIDPDVTNLDIQRIIEDGFSSNAFCQNLPELMTLDQARAYVKEKVEINSKEKTKKRND